MRARSGRHREQTLESSSAKKLCFYLRKVAELGTGKEAEEGESDGERGARAGRAINFAKSIETRTKERKTARIIFVCASIRFEKQTCVLAYVYVCIANIVASDSNIERMRVSSPY